MTIMTPIITRPATTTLIQQTNTYFYNNLPMFDHGQQIYGNDNMTIKGHDSNNP